MLENFMFLAASILVWGCIIGIPVTIIWGSWRKSPAAFLIGTVLTLLLSGYLYVTDNLPLWPGLTGAILLFIVYAFLKGKYNR